MTEEQKTAECEQYDSKVKQLNDKKLADERAKLNALMQATYNKFGPSVQTTIYFKVEKDLVTGLIPLILDHNDAESVAKRLIQCAEACKQLAVQIMKNTVTQKPKIEIVAR